MVDVRDGPRANSGTHVEKIRFPPTRMTRWVAAFNVNPVQQRANPIIPKGGLIHISPANRFIDLLWAPICFGFVCSTHTKGAEFTKKGAFYKTGSRAICESALRWDNEVRPLLARAWRLLN